MSVMERVKQVQPSTWDNIQLPAGKNYVLRTLSEYGDEYDDVLNILQQDGQQSSRIRKIERVQHPFAYGSFLLRKKQLHLQCTGSEPRHVFIKMKENQIAVALEYNLDKRRLTSHYGETEDCLIIAKCLRPSYHSIQRDSEIYPEYVVYYR